MPQAHLEKVLRHAESKLESESFRRPSDLMDIYRRFLKIEEHRLKLNHQSGGGGLEIALHRGDLMTVVLKHVWRGACESSVPSHVREIPPIALVAVGGFGRGELNPQSDIDLLFFHGKLSKSQANVVKDIVEQVLYMLWDVGFDVGHATRDEDSVVEQALADFQTRTAMLESRFICGDESLWKNFTTSFERRCLKNREDEYIDWRLADQKERHLKQGGTVFVQEPNIKNSCGGLRDYHSLLWIARVRKKLKSTGDLLEEKYITAGERKQLDEAYDFLLRLRTEMHYQQKRKGDVLTLQLQGKVANSLGYQHRGVLRRIEALMRDYYYHARSLYQITNSLALRLAGGGHQKAPVRWSLLPRKTQKVVSEEVDGFLLTQGVLEASDSSIFTEDPHRILRVFIHAQKMNAEIGPELQFKISRRLRLIDRSFTYHKATREMLIGLFSRKGEVGRIVRRMHELGVLGRLFPEFSPLTCLVQHEFFHRYTADEHTIVCLEVLDKILDANEDPFKKYKPLFVGVDKPYLLYLAMLLHDTGKSAGRRYHSDESAVNAVKVARRLKLGSSELSTLVFLTDHHLTMSDTAKSKNLDDPETVLNFARVVQTCERLDMLMLLTFADGKGTGGDTRWLDWREMLLWQLYYSTHDLLSGGQEFAAAAKKSFHEQEAIIRKEIGEEVDASELDAHFSGLPERYFHATSSDLIQAHIKGVHDFYRLQVEKPESALSPVVVWRDYPEAGNSEIAVITWDREKVFTKIAAAFAICGMSIWSADIYTRTDNIVIDTFRVSTPLWEAIMDERDQAQVRKTLDRIFTDPDYNFEQLIRGARQPVRLGIEGLDFPTRISFDQQSSNAYTVLSIQTPDRTGLLYRITNFLAEVKINIVLARITTEKGAALDTFYLDLGAGKKLPDERIRKLTSGLQKALET